MRSYCSVKISSDMLDRRGQWEQRELVSASPPTLPSTVEFHPHTHNTPSPVQTHSSHLQLIILADLQKHISAETAPCVYKDIQYMNVKWQGYEMDGGTKASYPMNISPLSISL